MLDEEPGINGKHPSLVMKRGYSSTMLKVSGNPCSGNAFIAKNEKSKDVQIFKVMLIGFFDINGIVLAWISALWLFLVSEDQVCLKRNRVGVYGSGEAKIGKAP